MTLDLDKYTLVDGQTPLSAAELNARFWGLVRRLHVLEQLSIDWAAAIAQVQNYGLARINDAVQPLVDSLKIDLVNLIAQGQADLASQSSAVAAKLAEVDVTMAAIETRIAAVELLVAGITPASIGAIPVSTSGAPGGVATLDAAGIVLQSQLRLRLVAECRLDLTGGNLLLSRCNGHRMIIDDIPQIIPAAGVPLPATGLTAATTYYIYACMVAGVMVLAASSTGHTADPRNGVRVKSDNAAWTLVGMARPIAGPAWVDDSVSGAGTSIGVVSYYNRRQKTVYFLEPASIGYASTSYGNCGRSLSALTWNGDVLMATMNGDANTPDVNSSASFSLSIDGDHSKCRASYGYMPTAYMTMHVDVAISVPLVEGIHVVQPIAKINTAGATITYGSGSDASVNGQTSVSVWG